MAWLIGGLILLTFVGVSLFVARRWSIADEQEEQRRLEANERAKRMRYVEGSG
jgi:hypothetical protein